MNERERDEHDNAPTHNADAEAKAADADRASDADDATRPLDEVLRERLHATAGKGERRTLTTLARELSQLPADRARATLEVSAGLAGVGLRVSRAFLRAVPTAARVLSADDLRAWGELGRRLASADAETGVNFFAAGVAGFGLAAGLR